MGLTGYYSLEWLLFYAALGITLLASFILRIVNKKYSK